MISVRKRREHVCRKLNSDSEILRALIDGAALARKESVAWTVLNRKEHLRIVVLLNKEGYPIKPKDYSLLPMFSNPRLTLKTLLRILALRKPVGYRDLNGAGIHSQ